MLRLYFRPHSTSIPVLLLTAQHRRLWQTYGAGIDQAFSSVTGQSFKSGVRLSVDIKTDSQGGIFEWSHAGKSNEAAIMLYYDSSAPSEYAILNQLCHELGHRLVEQHRAKSYIDRQYTNKEITTVEWLYETHRILFVFLIDVITAAFDETTASKIIKYSEHNYLESENSFEGTPAYKEAWLWAKNLSYQKRRAITRSLFTEHARLPSYPLRVPAGKH